MTRTIWSTTSSVSTSNHERKENHSLTEYGNEDEIPRSLLIIIIQPSKLGAYVSRRCIMSQLQVLVKPVLLPAIADENHGEQTLKRNQ